MANWRYKINIKEHFQEETTPKLVATLCSFLIKDLTHILESSQKSNITTQSVDDFWYELEGVKDNFIFLQHLADGTIPEDEWDDYEFTGDFKEEFNGYLEELYDIGDMRITLTNGTQEKLIWVQ